MVIQATQVPCHLNGMGITFISQLTQAPEHWFGRQNQNPFLQSSALQTKLTLPWLCSKYILSVAYFSASRQKNDSQNQLFPILQSFNKVSVFFFQRKNKKKIRKTKRLPLMAYMVKILFQLLLSDLLCMIVWLCHLLESKKT